VERVNLCYLGRQECLHGERREHIIPDETEKQRAFSKCCDWRERERERERERDDITSHTYEQRVC